MFGLVVAAAFLVIAIWPWVWRGQAPRLWALLFSIVFAFLAVSAPERLTFLNRLWFRFGLALNSIASPVMMGLLFYGAITPIGLIMRILGKDVLSLRRNDQTSYWIRNEPPRPPVGSMKNQF